MTHVFLKEHPIYACKFHMVVLLSKISNVFHNIFNTRVKITSCLRLLKTGLNNVVLPTLFNVANNAELVVEPEASLHSGVTLLNNIVDNIEQYGQHNIVQSCFQQLVIFCRLLNFPQKPP